MFNKINLYVFIQILKSCTLIFFIFLSISWLLQLTRLLTISNFIQIDIFNIVYLSLFLIPNLLTVIVPFILIFGILLCFLKLNRDREVIAIYSLGLELKPIKLSLYIFTVIIIFFYILLNFYLSPIIYEKYKKTEFELRNTINFDKIIVSNFLKINNDTIIDFKKNNNLYEDIFISFKDDKENLVYAKSGYIKNVDGEYIFQLTNGFKININGNEIEKLEFENYLLKFYDENNNKFNNFDKNTLTIFDDIKSKNYLNISYKITDIVFVILIIYFFYNNNIKSLNFTMRNNIYFVVLSIVMLVINQLLKNSNLVVFTYTIIILFSAISILFLSKLKFKYV